VRPVTTKEVTTVGPLGDGSIHVHRTGCADLRKPKYRPYAADSMYDEQFATFKEVVESFYGPDAGSFYTDAGYDPADPEVWREYSGEFKVFPCITLPDDEETT